jgi:hypothetical protein
MDETLPSPATARFLGKPFPSSRQALAIAAFQSRDLPTPTVPGRGEVSPLVTLDPVDRGEKALADGFAGQQV